MDQINSTGNTPQNTKKDAKPSGKVGLVFKKTTCLSAEHFFWGFLWMVFLCVIHVASDIMIARFSGPLLADLLDDENTDHLSSSTRKNLVIFVVASFVSYTTYYLKNYMIHRVCIELNKKICEDLKNMQEKQKGEQQTLSNESNKKVISIQQDESISNLDYAQVEKITLIQTDSISNSYDIQEKQEDLTIADKDESTSNLHPVQKGQVTLIKADSISSVYGAFYEFLHACWADTPKILEVFIDLIVLATYNSVCRLYGAIMIPLTLILYIALIIEQKLKFIGELPEKVSDQSRKTQQSFDKDETTTFKNNLDDYSKTILENEWKQLLLGLLNTAYIALLVLIPVGFAIQQTIEKDNPMTQDDFSVIFNLTIAVGYNLYSTADLPKTLRESAAKLHQQLTDLHESDKSGKSDKPDTNSSSGCCASLRGGSKKALRTNSSNENSNNQEMQTPLLDESDRSDKPATNSFSGCWASLRGKSKNARREGQGEMNDPYNDHPSYIV